MGQNLKLFEAMYQKMNWQEQRQKVIAQNIANSDTPGYAPRDLKPLQFKDLLGTSTSNLPLQKGLRNNITLSTTDKNHIGLGGSTNYDIKSKEQREVYETAPAGNAVILEEQLIKANQLASDHRLTTNLYKKTVNMLRTAIRGSGQ